MSLEPSELFLELVKAPRPHRIIDFPRTNPATGKPVGQVAIQLLTPEEQARSAAAAAKYCAELLGELKDAGQGYASVYTVAAASENLARSIRRADDLSKAFFPSSKAAREVLSPDESDCLVEAYATFQADLSPIEGGMTEAQVDAWMARIVEGANEVAPFFRLSSGAKNKLIVRLAQRLWASLNGSTTPGPLSEETTSNE